MPYLTGFLVSFVACYVLGRALTSLRPPPAFPSPGSGGDGRDSAAAEERFAGVAGGVSLAFGSVLALAFCTPPEGALSGPLKAVLGAAALVFFVGLAEEAGTPRRWPRFLALLAGAGIVCAWGLTIEAVKIPLIPHRIISLPPALAFPLTVAWLLAVSYAVSSTDRMPGLTSGIGCLTALTFLIVALWREGGENQPLTVSLALVLAGSSGGLLPHGLANRPLGIGHSGAAFLGFLLAATTVVGTLKNTAFLIIFLPVLALGVPLLNVTYARLHRFPTGETRTALHLHDMLLRRGFTPQRTVILLLALHGYFCLVALALVGIIEVSFLVKTLLLLLLVPAGFAIFFLISRIATKVATEVEPRGTISLLGVKVNTVTMDSALALIREFIREGTPHHVVTADASLVMKTREDPDLRDLVNAAALVTPDGAGVLWAAKVLDLPLRERVPGVDLTQAICEMAAREGFGVYFLGAAPGVAEKAAAALQAQFPGLRVVGTHDGYFQPEEEERLVEEIRAAQPDVLFVALGIPKQEKWIRQHQERLGVPVLIGVGGSFDVISGNLPRAPEWMQNCGLEWLYRVYLEPQRLPRLLALPRFVGLVAWDQLRQKGELRGTNRTGYPKG